MGGPYDKNLDYSGDFYKIGEGYGYAPNYNYPNKGMEVTVEITKEELASKLLDRGRIAYYIVVDDEIERATKKFGPFHSAMEGQAIVAEEFDEFTHAVRHETKERAREEAVQLAAMAIRFLMDVK